MKARYGKPPLSVEDQLKLLESRGMRIADPTFAAHALSTVSYYRLSAYSYPFRSRPDDGRFRDGTTFEEVWRYYRFDRRLKNVVLDGIERVEIATRTKIVNRFTELYGPFGYRETTNFAAPIDNVRFSKTLTLMDVIAPQSGWKDRLFALLAEFPDIHRLSMAMPSGFEHSALWK